MGRESDEKGRAGAESEGARGVIEPVAPDAPAGEDGTAEYRFVRACTSAPEQKPAPGAPCAPEKAES